jgi:hypothetical protein
MHDTCWRFMQKLGSGRPTLENLAAEVDKCRAAYLEALEKKGPGGFFLGSMMPSPDDIPGFLRGLALTGGEFLRLQRVKLAYEEAVAAFENARGELRQASADRLQASMARSSFAMVIISAAIMLATVVQAWKMVH